jgi:hypothetical protein
MMPSLNRVRAAGCAERPASSMAKEPVCIRSSVGAYSRSLACLCEEAAPRCFHQGQCRSGCGSLHVETDCLQAPAAATQASATPASRRRRPVPLSGWQTASPAAVLNEMDSAWWSRRNIGLVFSRMSRISARISSSCFMMLKVNGSNEVVVAPGFADAVCRPPESVSWDTRANDKDQEPET